MEHRLLGPSEVVEHDRVLAVGGDRERPPPPVRTGAPP
jgi:hypothetical protein